MRDALNWPERGKYVGLCSLCRAALGDSTPVIMLKPGFLKPTPRVSQPRETCFQQDRNQGFWRSMSRRISKRWSVSQLLTKQKVTISKTCFACSSFHTGKHATSESCDTLAGPKRPLCPPACCQGLAARAQPRALLVAQAHCRRGLWRLARVWAQGTPLRMKL